MKKNTVLQSIRNVDVFKKLVNKLDEIWKFVSEHGSQTKRNIMCSEVVFRDIAGFGADPGKKSSFLLGPQRQRAPIHEDPKG